MIFISENNVFEVHKQFIPLYKVIKYVIELLLLLITNS